MKPFALLALLLALSTVAIVKSQQITLVAQTSWHVPPFSYSGADAAVISAQIFSMTNAAGQPLVTIPALAPSKTIDLNARITTGPDTNVVSISGSGQDE